MVQYRRHFVPGGTFFFTTALRDRRSSLLIHRVTELREAFRTVRATRPFTTTAMVLLPDHLHAIWTLPAGDSDYPGRWRAIKSAFIRNLSKAGLQPPRNGRGEVLLWQRRFWEHTIRDETDYRRHVDYIHFNPVKHGFTARPSDWAYSTLHRFVARGELSSDWGGPPDDPGDMPDYGEP